MMRLGLAVAALVVGLDQATKWWIATGVFGRSFADRGLFEAFVPARRIEVTGFVNLVLTGNTGVSFGLFQTDSPLGAWVFAAVAVAIIGGLLIWLAKVRQRWLAAGIGLVIGGAVGNVVDRIRFGAVIDFLDFHLAGYHWPAFNLADSAITVGVALLFADALFRRRQSHKNT